MQERRSFFLIYTMKGLILVLHICIIAFFLCPESHTKGVWCHVRNTLEKDQKSVVQSDCNKLHFKRMILKYNSSRLHSLIKNSACRKHNSHKKFVIH